MKLTKFFPIILLVFPTFLYQCHHKDPDPVKVCRYMSDKLTYNYANSSGKEEYRVTYDSLGNLLRVTYSLRDTGSNGPTLTRNGTTTYVYDKNSLLTNSTYYYYELSNIDTTYSFRRLSQFIYDATNRLSKTTYSIQEFRDNLTTLSNASTYLKYNISGQIFSETENITTNGITEAKTYVYANGILNKVTIGSDNISGSSIYKFNQQGLFIDNNTTHRCTYDTRGNLLKDEYLVNGISFMSYTREYDTSPSRSKMSPQLKGWPDFSSKNSISSNTSPNNVLKATQTFYNYNGTIKSSQELNYVPSYNVNNFISTLTYTDSTNPKIFNQRTFIYDNCD